MNIRKWVRQCEANGNRPCEEALEWIDNLPPGTTLTDAWRLCHNGPWMLWALGRLPAAQYPHAAVAAVVERVVARAIRRGLRSLRGVREPWATTWRRWARRWLSGSDRTRKAARKACELSESVEARWAAMAARAAAAAAGSGPRCRRCPRAAAAKAALSAEAAAEAAATRWAAREAEHRRQARDIRAAIPEWPGEVGRKAHD